MLHPIFSRVLGHPELLVQHLANYAALIKVETGTATRMLIARLVAGAIALVSGALALAFVGTAVMLGVLHGSFHWVLVVLRVMWRRGRRRSAPSKTFVHNLTQTCMRCNSERGPMPIDARALTPQQRLAISRRALLRQLHGDHPDETLPPPHGYDDDAEGPYVFPSIEPSGWISVARRLGERWWRRHPANAVGQLAKPLLKRYAREQPFKVLGTAAAIGAAVVLIKPWRLLSITAVLAAVLKTSDVADLVTTLMHNNSNPRKDPP
jgi:hypothetical protein